MESLSPVIFLLMFWYSESMKTIPMLIFFFMWESHYLHRAFIYPFHIAGTKRAMPISVVFMAIIFNTGNAFLNGGHIYHYSGGYPDTWLNSPQMIAGSALFISGFIINKWSDRVLRNLRDDGEDVYKIPYGGLYRWISCPNYFGEIIEWTGWAIATWSLPGLAFALWTFANLSPRAHSNHKWYHQNFPDYPKNRKAFIPGIW
jgi:steroid 5-alpha reductase family enzyme